MLLKHVALECNLETTSDKFYQNLLGLDKVRSRILPSAIAKKIFGIDVEYKIIDYANDNIHLEVFIANKKNLQRRTVEHVCLEVDNLEEFLGRCKGMYIDILTIPKGDAFLTFVTDYDGNLFEIKGK